MDTWITDTPTSERFPIYTRGNADEVGPEPFSPLGWSLSWAQGICPGVADGWCSLGGFTPDEFVWPVPETFGNWGGYFFNQVSVGRVFGLRSPGGSPDMIDESFFGKNPTVPPYVADPRDESPQRSAVIGEVFAGVLGADRQPQYVTDFIAQVRGVGRRAPGPATMSDAELIEFGREANIRLRATWDVYTVVTISAGGGLGIVGGWPLRSANRNSRWRPSVRSDTSRAPAPLAGCGGSREVARAARRRRSPARSTPGRRRAGAPAHLPPPRGAAEFVRGFDEMLATDGHRGPNEWEIMSDSWGHAPSSARHDRQAATPGRRPSHPTAAPPQSACGATRRSPNCRHSSPDDPANSAMLQPACSPGPCSTRRARPPRTPRCASCWRPGCRSPSSAGGGPRPAPVRDPEHVFMLLDSELDPSVASIRRLGAAAGRAGRNPRRPQQPDPAVHRCSRRADSAEIVMATSRRSRHRSRRGRRRAHRPRGCARPRHRPGASGLRSVRDQCGGAR